jgi:EAL domain-containing protein (putative c-di-GMP-specific phosphodiesterase class I)
MWRTCRQHAAYVYVVMEISERQAIDRIAPLKAKSEELASCGVSLAMDHCGRGNSSFQMFNQIRFSEIKIDQSLVRDCDKDQARANVCKSIIQMAHNFSIKATAVGIETAAEARELAIQDCDFNQGYLFGKPMTQKQLMDMGRAACLISVSRPPLAAAGVRAGAAARCRRARGPRAWPCRPASSC